MEIREVVATSSPDGYEAVESSKYNIVIANFYLHPFSDERCAYINLPWNKERENQDAENVVVDDFYAESVGIVAYRIWVSCEKFPVLSTWMLIEWVWGCALPLGPSHTKVNMDCSGTTLH